MLLRFVKQSTFLAIFLTQIFAFVSAKSVVYISLKKDNKIAIYEEDSSTGLLTKLSNQTVDGAPGSIAISPNREQLYVAQRSAKTISCYNIDLKTGLLSFVNKISAADDPVYLSTDKTGKYLLSAYFGASKIAIYGINTDGSLASGSLVELDTPANPHAINTNNGNDFLYVTCMTGDRILQFNFDGSTGTITPLSTAMVETPDNTGPRHFVFHPSSDHVYVSNEVASSVSNYRYSKSGYLGVVETFSTISSNFSGTNKCADIHISPDAKFLFVSNRGEETIAVFEIEEDASLEKVGHFATEATPREMAIDDSGKFLFAVGESSDKLQSYTIDRSTGKLLPLQNFNVGNTPVWIEVVKLNEPSSGIDAPIKAPTLVAIPNPFSYETRIQSSNYTPNNNLFIYSDLGKLICALQPETCNSKGTIFRWNGKSSSGKQAAAGIYKGVLKSTAGTEVVSLLLQQ